MFEPKIIDVYGLVPVANVCDQVLREVVALPKVSMAHVIMNEGNISLWHQHSSMTEIYFILKGEGVLYHGDRALQVEKGAYLVLPPNTPHKLKNTGNQILEHLVFTVPPFNPADVRVLEDTSSNYAVPEKFKQNKLPFVALDGAIVYELMSPDERKELDVSLAIGFLEEGKKAKPHRHNIGDEIYYVLEGVGKAKVGEYLFDIKPSSLICVPKGYVHALENSSSADKLNVLCLSSPSYTAEDFILD